jgi:hypothetical protein
VWFVVVSVVALVMNNHDNSLLKEMQNFLLAAGKVKYVQHVQQAYIWTSLQL